MVKIVMFSLLKCCFGKQKVQNIYSRVLSNYILRKGYNHENLKKVKYGRCKNRILRTLSTQTVLKPARVIFSTDDNERFKNCLPNIIKDIIEDEKYSKIPEAVERFSYVLKYNLPNGTKIIGLSTLASYKILAKPENITDESIRLATILGWCNELFATSYILLDDIMDNSETRRNAPCWFRVKGVGLTAINDALFLANSSYALLKKYFSSHPMYMPVMELFHDTSIKITYGQCIDNLRPTLEQLTIDRFNRLTMYKAGYYLPLVPVILGMYLSETYSVDLHQKIEPILIEMGRYMQAENDMWDCFGDADTTGKIGTDIQRGKCTWLAAMAVQKASLVQRKLIEEHYGRPERESDEIIRNLYEDLDIPTEYMKFKEESYEKICSQIRKVTRENDAMRTLLFTLIEKLFNRRYT